MTNLAICETVCLGPLKQTVHIPHLYVYDLCDISSIIMLLIRGQLERRWKKTFGFWNEVLPKFAEHSMASESHQWQHQTTIEQTRLSSAPSDIKSWHWAYLLHAGQSTTKECAIWLYGRSTMPRKTAKAVVVTTTRDHNQHFQGRCNTVIF